MILGCPLTQVPFGERALRLSDLSLIALVPMTHATGAAVERELEVAAWRTGRPALIVADQGSDLVKGIASYRELRPDVAHVPDIAHYGANLLQRQWEGDPQWAEFVAKLQATSTAVRQSSAASLVAPRLRLKSRFMNVRTPLRFAQRVLAVLESPSPSGSVVAHYGWLRSFRAAVSAWVSAQTLVDRTIALLRVEGLHAGSQSRLAAVWDGVAEPTRATATAAGLVNYVRRYQPQESGVTYAASTEVLESSFGKLKRWEGVQSSSGFTGLSLALGVAVGHWDESAVAAALSAVPAKQVSGWVQRTLGRSVQWLRNQLLGRRSVPDRG